MTLKEKILEIFHIRIFGAVAGGYNAAEDIAAYVEQNYYPKKFVEWYSGMEAHKIENAYQRYLREK